MSDPNDLVTNTLEEVQRLSQDGRHDEASALIDAAVAELDRIDRQDRERIKVHVGILLGATDRKESDT